MRRYSFTYFFRQAFLGLWRNGVMSFASISALTSCLVVIGSFSLLLFNVDRNLEDIGALNYIVCFVDTDLEVEKSTGAAPAGGETSSENDAGGEKEESDRFLPADREGLAEVAGSYTEQQDAETLMQTVRECTDALKVFKDLDEAYTSAWESRKMLAALRLMQLDSHLDATSGVALSEVQDYFEPLYKRVSLLYDIRRQILALDNVTNLDFLSREAALEEVRQEYAGHTNLFDNIEAGEGILTDKFTITYEDNSKVPTLKYELERLDGHLYKVDCREDLAQTLENVKQGIIFVFLWFLAILFVVSMFVIINTVKLAVFARRQEITVMRYVGATNWFITFPFVLEGILIGLFSGAVAYGLQYGLYRYVQKTMIAKIQFISIAPFADIYQPLLLGFFAIGIFTGVVGSLISLRKYVKV